MYWEDQSIYYELYHKILKPIKGTRKLILMTEADKQAQLFHFISFYCWGEES